MVLNVLILVWFVRIILRVIYVVIGIFSLFRKLRYKVCLVFNCYLLFKILNCYVGFLVVYISCILWVLKYLGICLIDKWFNCWVLSIFIGILI